MEYLDKIEKLHYRSGKTSIDISEEIELERKLITFPVRIFSPFYKQIEDTIQKLLEAGICPYRLNGKLSEEKFRNKRFDEEIPPLVLSMEDLGIGFEVCMIPLALSFFVFSVEIIWPRMKLSAKEYLTAVYVVFTFFESSRPGL